MPNTREKLIELLQCSPTDIMGNRGVGALADHLIANGVTVQQWRSRQDPPTEMRKYLCRYVFGAEGDYVFEQVLWYYPQLEKPHFQHEGSMGLRVTHWMPLPEPPKED